MILNETFTLSNDVKIPKLGLGTWFVSDEDVVLAAKDAVALGYRHIDTAQAYQNERGVGEGVKTCGVKREELFITTKLAAEAKTYNEAVASIDASLKLMGFDYVDTMISHSLQPWMEYGDDEERCFEGNKLPGGLWKRLTKQEKSGRLVFPTF